MDWVNIVSYDQSMVAFGNHCSSIAHIHPINGNGKDCSNGGAKVQVKGYRSQVSKRAIFVNFPASSIFKH